MPFSMSYQRPALKFRPEPEPQVQVDTTAKYELDRRLIVAAHALGPSAMVRLLEEFAAKGGIERHRANGLVKRFIGEQLAPRDRRVR